MALSRGCRESFERCQSVAKIKPSDLHRPLYVEENVKTGIVEEPLRGAKKADGTIRNTDHTTTVRWSDIVKNGRPELIGDEMSSKVKSS